MLHGALALATIHSRSRIFSLIYPVRGTERDFARFFVLETVARVPYFAYLVRGKSSARYFPSDLHKLMPWLRCFVLFDVVGPPFA